MDKYDENNSVKKKPEVILDFSDEENGKIVMNIEKNETLVKGSKNYKKLYNILTSYSNLQQKVYS